MHAHACVCTGSLQPALIPANQSAIIPSSCQSRVLCRAGTVIGISGTKTADEDCVLGAEQFFWEDAMG